MEQDGYQALASEAAARIGELAARAPAWMIDLAAVVVAIVALACHAIFMSVARRVVDSRAVFVKSLLTQTRGPTRLALVIIALSFAAAAAPLSYFIEKPFQNWTRQSPALIGSVLIYVDYTVPVARVREELTKIASRSKLWDGQVVNLQVTDAKHDTVELRALVSAANAPAAWDLRCEVREALIAFLQREYPHALPKQRAEVTMNESAGQTLERPTPLRTGAIAERAAERSRAP
jgi:hypothetical protein